MDTLNVISFGLTVFSTVFALILWIISRRNSHEFSKVIRSIYGMTGNAIMEAEVGPVGDAGTKLYRVENLLTVISDIHELTKSYLDNWGRPGWGNMLELLAERKILWTLSQLFELEKSESITETWLVTPDLEPDSSSPKIGKLVGRNIGRGMGYVFFHPESLPFAEREYERLYENIGLGDADPRDRRTKAKVIAVADEAYYQLPGGGNIVLYYSDQRRNRVPRCFQEVVLTKVSTRGAFWQEHSEGKTKEICRLLESELNKYSPNAAA